MITFSPASQEAIEHDLLESVALAIGVSITARRKVHLFMGHQKIAQKITNWTEISANTANTIITLQVVKAVGLF